MHLNKIKEEYLMSAFKRLKNKLLIDLDQNASFMVKDCIMRLSEFLTHIFNLIDRTDIFSDRWKTARVSFTLYFLN